jgi:hypothetical protein
MIKRLSTAALLVALLAGAVLAAAPGRLEARAFLADAFGVAGADLARLHDGRVITRTLGTANKREVATLGVIRVKVTPAYYVEQLRDIVSFKRSDAVLQVGTFSDPPVLQDVAAMTLEDDDLRQLGSCSVGDCGVRLSADGITRMRSIDWRAGNAHERANLVMRQLLVDYVAAYKKSGAAVSMRYADSRDGVAVGREARELAARDGAGWKHFPVLAGHVVDYAGGVVPGMIDVIYWSKEKVAARNVISITHLAIAAGEEPAPAEHAVASKQIYATHYFDASLGLTVLLRDEQAPAPATYVVYLNRSRVDMFGGFFGGVTKTIVTGKARGTVGDHLTLLQQRLERQFARPRPVG